MTLLQTSIDAGRRFGYGGTIAGDTQWQASCLRMNCESGPGTGYARAAEQCRILDEQDIPYKSVGSRTIVLHQHVAAGIEGRPVRRIVEPNWALVKGQTSTLACVRMSGTTRTER